MANRNWNAVETTKHGVREVFVRFFPNGTSTAALTVRGSGVAGVVRTGAAGVFTVTFEDAWQEAALCGFQGTVQHVTAVDLKAQIGTFTSGTASAAATCTVSLLAVATPTDMTANANSSVCVSFFFQNNPRQT